MAAARARLPSGHQRVRAAHLAAAQQQQQQLAGGAAASTPRPARGLEQQRRGWQRVGVSAGGSPAAARVPRHDGRLSGGGGGASRCGAGTDSALSVCSAAGAACARVLRADTATTEHSPTHVRACPKKGVSGAGRFRLCHWDTIDAFVYFSHHLVSVPPPGWVAPARAGRSITIQVPQRARVLSCWSDVTGVCVCVCVCACVCVCWWWPVAGTALACEPRDY